MAVATQRQQERKLKAWIGGALLVIPVAVVVAFAIAYQTAFEGQRRALRRIAAAQASVIQKGRSGRSEVDAPDAPTSDVRLEDWRDSLDEFASHGLSTKLRLARIRHGKLEILHPDDDDDVAAAPRVDSEVLSASMFREHPRGTRVGSNHHGKRVLSAHHRAGASGVFVVVQEPMAVIRAPFLRAGGYVLLVTLLLQGVAFVLVRRGALPVLRRLRETTQSLETVARYAGGLIYRADGSAERRLRFVAPGSERLLGSTPDQLVGTTLEERIHGSDRERVHAEIQAALNEGRSFEVSYRLGDADGRYLWTLDQGTPLSRNGEVTIFGLVLDASSTKELEQAHERLASIVQASPNVVGLTDPQGRPLGINPAAERLLGMSETELFHGGYDIWDFFPEWAREMLAERAFPTAERQGWWQGESAVLGRDGEEIPVRQVVLAHRDADGSILYYSTTVEDLSERRRLEEELAAQKRNFEHVLTDASVGILVLDEHQGCVLFANPEFGRILGRPAEDLRGSPLGIPLTGGRTQEVDLIRPGGETRIAEMRVSRTIWDGEVASLVMVQDITAQRVAEAQWEHLARHDPVTDLPNRRAFYGHIASSIARGSGDEVRKKQAVLVMDVDRFSRINDAFGHDTGDELLRTLAGSFRELVPNATSVARVGGDEFALLVEGLSDAAEADATAENLRAALTRPLTVGSRRITAPCTIGYSLFPDDGADAETILRRAHIAKDLAQREGRNLAVRYTADASMGGEEEMEIRNRFATALEQEEFFLVYQPHIDLPTGQLAGCEALIRWQHPERGMLPPGLFIPALEDTGLIEDAGDWVLRTAMAQARTWDEQGRAPGRVTVNVSPRQLRRGDIVERVAAALEDTGVAPSRIGLEITESGAVADAETSIAALRRLRALGLTIYLDDFGKGYSSLNHVRQLPVDVVKIDKEFVQDTTTRTEAAELTRAIISMGHNVGMRVLAEGVETAEHAAFLRAEGCELAQGFYYDRPLVPRDFEARLKPIGRGVAS